MTRRRVLVVSAIAIMSATIVAAAGAQTTSSKPLAFEVASIKLNTANDGRIMIQPAPGGRLTMTNSSLRMLIRFAYNIQDNQMIGGPSWLDSDRYDVVAKADGDATREQMREMLQTLLAERFQLKTHRETRELPVYALVVAKNGPKLKQTDANPTGPAGGVRMMRGPATSQVEGILTMAQFVQMLSTQLGRTILDKTGLAGNYEVKLEWMPDPSEGMRGMGGMPIVVGGDRGAPPPPDPSLTSIYTAIQEQLGLRLDSQKGPVEVLVLDSAQKPATDN